MNISHIICVVKMEASANHSCVILSNGERLMSKSYPKSIINKIEKARKEVSR
ncbi:hypothetical protein [Ruminococcus sp.]|uniref:hypothetical protein n=1 Tax=Ruminococcus sp. TaxID=41978 RepID=UPI003F01761A